MGATLRLNSKGGARWHPYSRITTHHSAPSLAATGLDTPLSTHTRTVDSFQPQAPRPQPPQLTAQYLLYQKERLDARRAQKERLDHAFKEFCVKRLSDIWKESSYVKNSMYSRPNIRPPYPATTFQSEEPAPVKLETYLSPPLSPSPLSFQTVAGPTPTRGAALRPFVYDVLRRSKTAWPALQVALCYLDAVRDKVTEAMAEVQRAEGLASAEAALDGLFNFSNVNESTTDSKSPSAPQSHAVTQTVSPPEDGYATGAVHSAALGLSTQEPPRRIRRRKVPTVPPEPLPPRPSPLLCPRRMFIAALILACKFTQDRVYSNRAWARICGLDAREVSRCERALGEALEWRLWVGKDKPTAFLRSVLQNEDLPVPATLRPECAKAAAAKKTPECHLFTPQSASGSPFTSPPECSPQNGPVSVAKSVSMPSELFYTTQNTPTQTFSRDFSTALKKTSSWCYSDAPASQLTMTPANADLDAMDFEHGAPAVYSNRVGGYAAYLSPNGSANGSTPALTYDTPSAASSVSYSDEYSFIPTGAAPSPLSHCTPKQATEHAELGFGMPSPAAAHAHYQSGVEGTFDVKLCDDDIVASSSKEFLM